ncbi:MAG TPA: SCO family protein, partial [Candidatus Eremiobacteraceae bacterium]|nr:SCO family protein [Candidatus Eremiobacteraceae bacterium]
MKVASTMREFGEARRTPRAQAARLARSVCAVCCAIGVVAGLGSHRADARSAAQPKNPFSIAPVSLLAPGDRVPSGSFVDQNGSPTTMDDYRGKTVVVGFIYTSCKDECPLITRKFGLLEQQLPNDRFHLVEISIDPAHDTPRVLAAYARRYGVNLAERTLLTGSPDAIAAFERQLGVSAIDNGHGTIIHNSRTVIVDAGGRISDIVDEAAWTPADIAADAKSVAGMAANPIDRLDLALGRAVAYVCGGFVSGR